MILTPRSPTLQRWLKLSFRRHSLLRSLQYEAINNLLLRGTTLDVGGGRKSDYLPRLRIEGRLDSINIDPSMKSTILADLNDPWPVASESYDNVISLNTFEHLINDRLALRQMARVLKPGGRFFVLVPFMFRIHGSPSDHHRHTAFWWEEFLVSLGLSRDNIIVDPLMWDPISSAYSLIEFNPLRIVLKPLTMLPALPSHLRWAGKERLPDKPGQARAQLALGYFIQGAK